MDTRITHVIPNQSDRLINTFPGALVLSLVTLLRVFTSTPTHLCHRKIGFGRQLRFIPTSIARNLY